MAPINTHKIICLINSVYHNTGISALPLEYPIPESYSKTTFNFISTLPVSGILIVQLPNNL